MLNYCKEIVANLAAYAALWGCRRRHTGGTAFPGKLARKICPDILTRRAAGVKTIIVTSSNGKGTTVRMIAGILASLGLPYFANTEGANTELGITSTFVLKNNLLRRAPQKLAVIECDELYLAKICRLVQPQVLVFTTIVADQVDRLGTAAHIGQLFKKVTARIPALLCLNLDNPYTAALQTTENSGRVFTYAVQEHKILVNGQAYPVHLAMPGAYNLHNAAAACAAAAALKLPLTAAVQAVQKVTPPYGRMEKISLDGATITMNLTKNATGLNLTLAYLAAAPSKYRLAFGINNHGEDGRDLTWLDKVEFKKYRPLLDRAIVLGDGAPQVAAHLQKAGLPEADIQHAAAFPQLLELIKSSDAPVFLLLNYSCMMGFRNFLARQGYVKDFWQK